MSTIDDLMALVEKFGNAVYECQGSAIAYHELRTAIETALAAEYERGRSEREQDAEPVAWLYTSKANAKVLHTDPSLARFRADMRAATEYPDAHTMVPLYTAPPKRKPLTDEQIDAVTFEQWGDMLGVMAQAHRTYARAIERAHGISDE